MDLANERASKASIAESGDDKQRTLSSAMERLQSDHSNALARIDQVRLFQSLSFAFSFLLARLQLDDHVRAKSLDLESLKQKLSSTEQKLARSMDENSSDLIRVAC